MAIRKLDEIGTNEATTNIHTICVGLFGFLQLSFKCIYLNIARK